MSERGKQPTDRIGFGLAMFILVLLLSILAPEPWQSPAYADPTTTPAKVDNTPDGFTIFSLQSGTPLFILLQTPISTSINQPDDPIEAAVAQDLYLGARLIVSKNARVRGRIAVLEKPIKGRNAILALRFTELTLPNGDVLPIESYVKTERPDHLWGGELTEGTKPMRVTHRVEGIGAYNKLVFGGPRAMGTHLKFSPGERFTLILEKPVSIVLPKIP